MTDEPMRTASFIHIEDDDDLIISFALYVYDSIDVDSLTLLRTPKYEFFLEEQERGVRVSLQLMEKGLLKEFAFDRDVVRLRTTEWSFEVDVRKVSKSEIRKMFKVLKLMNFDRRFKISGVK
jgi:hypothetical protein